MEHNRFDSLLHSLAQTPSRRNALRLLAGSTLGGLLTAGAGTAGARKGDKGKAKGKKKKDSKVTICHQGQTMAVSKSSLKAHLAHGDREGACATGDQSQPSSPSGPAGPTCSDGITNGSETDVDCGGGTCLRCATGKTCSSRNDCASARCEAGTCQTCVNGNTDCGTDSDGSPCFCRDHESGQRFCTKQNALPGRVFPAGTPCTTCQGGEQCFPINGGLGGIECIRPCGAPTV